MKFRTIVGLFIVLIVYSCIQKPLKKGLIIENDRNRGLNYTDSLGAKYNLRYIPITITNDNINPIHIQIAFSNEYDYPSTFAAAYGDQKFKVFPFPKKISPDEVTWDTISYELGKGELRDFLDRGFDTPYVLNETVEPGEKFILALGTLYPRPSIYCGAVPNVLFSQINRDLLHTCDSLINQIKTTNSESALWLKVDFCHSGVTTPEFCLIIPCGRISYPEH